MNGQESPLVGESAANYTCPTECVETNHPGMEHEQWLLREEGA